MSSVPAAPFLLYRSDGDQNNAGSGAENAGIQGNSAIASGNSTSSIASLFRGVQFAVPKGSHQPKRLNCRAAVNVNTNVGATNNDGGADSRFVPVNPADLNIAEVENHYSEPVVRISQRNTDKHCSFVLINDSASNNAGSTHSTGGGGSGAVPSGAIPGSAIANSAIANNSTTGGFPIRALFESVLATVFLKCKSAIGWSKSQQASPTVTVLEVFENEVRDLLAVGEGNVGNNAGNVGGGGDGNGNPIGGVRSGSRERTNFDNAGNNNAGGGNSTSTFADPLETVLDSSVPCGAINHIRDNNNNNNQTNNNTNSNQTNSNNQPNIQGTSTIPTLQAINSISVRGGIYLSPSLNEYAWSELEELLDIINFAFARRASLSCSALDPRPGHVIVSIYFRGGRTVQISVVNGELLVGDIKRSLARAGKNTGSVGSSSALSLSGGDGLGCGRSVRKLK